jgi:hypothetical protein
VKYTLLRRETLGLDVLLAVVFAGVILAGLIVSTGGLIIWVVMAAAAITAFGLLHYFLWGWVESRGLARAAVSSIGQTQPAMPEDEINVVLSERERVELIGVLEQSLTRVDATPGSVATAGTQTQREVLSKLRAFGA